MSVLVRACMCGWVGGWEMFSSVFLSPDNCPNHPMVTREAQPGFEARPAEGGRLRRLSRWDAQRV